MDESKGGPAIGTEADFDRPLYPFTDQKQSAAIDVHSAALLFFGADVDNLG